MYAESSPVIEAIARRTGVPLDNLHLRPVNVLDRDAMVSAASHFGTTRFAVCNEGLLMYLDMDEKAMMAGNVRGLLLRAGGCWITTDITLGEARKKIASMLGPVGKVIAKSAMKNIAAVTGRNISENDFKSTADAFNFYNDLGFEVEEVPMYDGEYTLATLSLIPEKQKVRLLDALSSAKTWMMTPRQ